MICITTEEDSFTQQARKLQATLVRNYDSLTRSLTDGGEV